MSPRVLPALALLLALAACNDNGSQAAPSHTPSPTVTLAPTPSPTTGPVATPSANVDYDRSCEQNPSATQRDLNECAAGELAEVEKLLPALLQQARKIFTPALVDQGQSRWLAFRETECRMEGSFFEGGSIRPMTEDFCKRSLTVDRITELRQVIKAYTDTGAAGTG